MSIFSRKESNEPTIVVKNINNKFNKFKANMESAFSKKSAKEIEKREFVSDKVVYLLKFKGDIVASQVNAFREEISAIISFAKKGDEVIIDLFSMGGTVTGYGLASDQIERLKRKGLKVTIVVDEVAASGGYMMASVADRIVASKRAVVGSIGVVVNMPNYRELCKKLGITFTDFTAGDKKRGVTPYNEPTEEQKEDLIKQLKVVHESFKSHISEHRPIIDIEKVSTGETWSGKDALELKLIDEIGITDDVIFDFINNNYMVLHVSYVLPKKKQSFLSRQLSCSLVETIDYSFNKAAKLIVSSIHEANFIK